MSRRQSPRHAAARPATSKVPAAVASGSLAVVAVLVLVSGQAFDSSSGLIRDAAADHGPVDPWIPEPLVAEAAARPRAASTSPVARPLSSTAPFSPSTVAYTGAIPVQAQLAYQAAARRHPDCGLTWNVIAGIGEIESQHALHYGGADPHWDGIARPSVLGPLLTGGQFAVVPDSDNGVLDGSTMWDRAVGPMQFLPSTWRVWGVDADKDGRANPEDIRDAAASTADYLCSTGPLRTPAALSSAIFRYNHSTAYVRSVLEAALSYGQTPVVRTAVGTLPAPTTEPVITVLSPEPDPPAPAHSPSASPSSSHPTPAPRPTAAPTPAPAPADPTPTESASPDPDSSSPPRDDGGYGS